MPFASCLVSSWFVHLRSRKRRPTLPDRIDGPMVEQPTCRLLQLPLELRHLIFEMAVANRLFHIELAPTDEWSNCYIIKATCYVPPERPGTPKDLWDAAESIPLALILTCRAVYVEALPIIHRRNTFSFHLGQFPHIREIYLYHPKHPVSSFIWETAFDILRHMRLDTLILELHSNDCAVVYNDAWRRRLLAIRNLRNLDIFFQCTEDSPLPPEAAQAIKEIHDLMIGPLADEKYAAFLQTSDTFGQ
ncbi:hypothetical protein K438DRAFT_1856983 [Mycena galopus ATCC 62051]|nr:hypothetical protein K438DRAFT_1856983 [Mycena galopus ATCC 62051]